MNYLINKKQHLLFVLLALAFIFACDKDKSPTNPENSGVYAGYWEGTTGQNRPIYFHVTTNGVVDSLAIRLRMDFATMYCIAYFMSDTSAQIKSKNFDLKAKLPPGVSDIYTTVHGGFVSEDSASGTYSSYSGQFFLYCGSSLIMGSGYPLNSGSWGASKVTTTQLLKPRLDSNVVATPIN